MKRYISVGLIGLAVLLLGGGCASDSQVSRGDSVEDLSGDWNANDVEIACNALVQKCLDSPSVAQEIQRLGRPIRIQVGKFPNETSDHINTSIISDKIGFALLNSGKARLAASGATRDELRQERQDQQSNASEETAAALGNETAPDFQLNGSVKDIKDKAGNTSTGVYYVVAVLTDYETRDQIWGDQVEIKKTIKRSKNKL